MGCGTNTFPDNWVTIMMEKLTVRLNNPTGVWADLNPTYRMWRIFREFIEQGLICEADFPDGPDPDDYSSDFTSGPDPELIALIGEVEYHCGADSDFF